MNLESFTFLPGLSAIQMGGVPTTLPVAPKTDHSFASFYDAYVGLLGETNNLQMQAETLQLDFVAGKTDDMTAVLLAQEKAYASLNFTVQITNKVIDAYREIMRIAM